LAEFGGALGIDILTPLGLAHMVAPVRQQSTADVSWPAGHPWESVKERPGLKERLEGHLADIRLAETPADKVARTARVLLDAGLGRDAEVEALLALETRARLQRSSLSPDHDYGAVFAIGFGDDAGAILAPPRRSFHRRLLAALGAIRLSTPACSLVSSVPATVVSDPTAEARWVAARASVWIGDAERSPSSVLVLVANRDDANRIRTALGRSGIPAADDDARPFTEHGLVTLIRAVRPWFEAPSVHDLVLEAEALRRLFTSPLVSSGLNLDKEKQEALLSQFQALEVQDEGAADETPVTAAAGSEESPRLFLSRRSVPRALAACRLIRGTHAGWTAALLAVGADPGQSPSVRRAALLLNARLEGLALAHGSTLGHVRALLDSLGVASVGFADPVARAILAALRDGKERAATEAELDDVLAGAVGSGEVHRGAVLLPYAAYDGRPAGLCLLTGLHSKGLGAAPAPDPFFTDDEMRAWDRPGATESLAFLRDQALAAAARAGHFEGVVSRRDATGRAVAPVAELPLRFEPHALEAPTVLNYGLQHGTVPEAANLRALTPETECWPAGISPQAVAPDVDAAARAASLEWVRSGSGPEVPPEPEQAETLVDLLQRVGGSLPPELVPWLGDARTVRVAHLPPDTPLSATGAFQPLTHCLFQAYLKVRLRLREAEEFEEELDAREVGTAIHSALESLGLDPRWRVGSEEAAKHAKAELAAALAKEIGDRIEDLGNSRAVATAGVTRARRGSASRWVKHVESYVDKRLEIILDAESEAVEATAKWASGLPVAKNLLAAARKALPKRSTLLNKWFRALVANAGLRSAPTAPGTFDAAFAMNEPARTEISTWYAANRDAADAAIAGGGAGFDAAIDVERARRGPVTGAGRIEWPFGKQHHDPQSQEFRMALGAAADVSVAGAVDRTRVLGSGPDSVVELADYKTGAVKQKKRFANELAAAVAPQLPLYALVLREALERHAGPEGVPATCHPFVLAYDYVRAADPEKGWLEEVPGVTGPPLERWAEVLGALVERARTGLYLLLPHGLTCPAAREREHDYCPFADACRFRRLPGTPLSDEEEAVVSDEDADEAGGQP
jgi:RecB family exonuclease